MADNTQPAPSPWWTAGYALGGIGAMLGGFFGWADAGTAESPPVQALGGVIIGGVLGFVLGVVGTAVFRGGARAAQIGKKGVHALEVSLDRKIASAGATCPGCQLPIDPTDKNLAFCSRCGLRLRA